MPALVAVDVDAVDPPRWTTADALDTVGVTYRQLDHWQRSGYRPRVPAHGSGSRRCYSTGDLAALAVIRVLTDGGWAIVPAVDAAYRLRPRLASIAAHDAAGDRQAASMWLRAHRGDVHLIAAPEGLLVPLSSLLGPIIERHQRETHASDHDHQAHDNGSGWGREEAEGGGEDQNGDEGDEGADRSDR